MDVSRKILSDIIIYSKYAKYDEILNRRETWNEIVDRNVRMHSKKYPELTKEIEEAYKYVYERKVLPSMRSMQFAGKAIELNPARLFNCSYAPIDSIDAISEGFFLLLSGCGFGYSVQSHHVDKLPEIRKPDKDKTRRYLVSDDIVGWAEAMKTLLKSYTGKIKSNIIFDYRAIREKGTPLVTSGGVAPGSQPLEECIVKIKYILENKKEGEKLRPIEVHDIMCHIANAVLSGGIRRSSCISLFDVDDHEMLSCKTGNWWELNPQRALCNNSAVIVRHKVDEKTFKNILERTKNSNAGEPGIFLTNDKDYGTNPCGEIGLRPYSFCNLTEVDVSTIDSQEELNKRMYAAAFIGTLQASYTDFHYLREIWKRNTEKDALIGVSITGIASNTLLDLSLEQASKIVREANKYVANRININSAARLLTVKPSGTASLVLGTSSGIHPYHDKFYIRRMRINKDEPLYKYVKETLPELVEDEFFNPKVTSVISIPQKAPENAILRNEGAIEMLNRIKYYYSNWIKKGHVKGDNTNNISATVSVKNNEWDDVIQWMWENKNFYNGISLLPFDEHSYKQPPFETITEEQYNNLFNYLKDIDLSKIIEYENNTKLQGEVACGGGSCEIF